LLGILAAVITLASWRVGLLFWGLALAVGLARVYARVHHLADVFGSFGIVLIALGVYLVGRELYHRWRKVPITTKL
jgi:membrane-associated phospholipid phosphatase